jgi:hypothetical protein
VPDEALDVGPVAFKDIEYRILISDERQLDGIVETGSRRARPRNARLSVKVVRTIRRSSMEFVSILWPVTSGTASGHYPMWPYCSAFRR